MKRHNVWVLVIYSIMIQLDLYLGLTTTMLRHPKDLLFPHAECLSGSFLLFLCEVSGIEVGWDGRVGP